MASPAGSSSASEGEAEGSVLGTHAHWAAAYAAELAEFEASAGADQGEVWFGEDTQATMVRFVTALVDAEAAAAAAAGGGDASSGAAAQTPEAARAGWRVLDLGCGNGALCVALARAGCVARRARAARATLGAAALTRVARRAPARPPPQLHARAGPGLRGGVGGAVAARGRRRGAAGAALRRG
jgi:hypothetical protein